MNKTCVRSKDNMNSVGVMPMLGNILKHVNLLRSNYLSNRTKIMSTVNNQLQKLIDKEIGKRYTHNVLLGVQSGDGKIDFKGAAGEASPESPYFVASIAKIFTATVIMQLFDEGKLHLEDYIEKYLSHLPLDGIHKYKGIDYSKKLKVYQLLNQTSGLSDYFEGGLAEDFKKNQDRSYSLEDVLEMARNSNAFSPPDSGKSYYSDTNFQLLGEIIETITGQSLNDVFKARIFNPLGMTETYLFDHNNASKPMKPIPPYYKDTQLSLPLAITSERGTGGAVSTMSDLLMFLRSFFEGNLFKKNHLKSMMKWNSMFFPMQYGYGIWRYKLPRWANMFRETPEFIGHAGVWGAMAFYNPKNDIYIVGTLNQLHKPARQFSFMPRVLNIVTGV